MKCAEFHSLATATETVKPIIQEALNMHARGPVEMKLLDFPESGSYLTG